MHKVALPLAMLALLCLGGCGTTYLKQGANQFNSNTYVGWIPPDRGLVSSLSGPSGGDVWAYNVRGLEGAKHAVALNDCFAVDYAGGYFHDSFEGALEKAWAWMSGTSVRSEVSIVLKAEQRIPESKRTSGTSDLKEEGTFVFSNTGQLRSRHFTGNSYDNFFGQTRYRGGELQLSASISEQDKDEYNEMVSDSLKFAKTVSNAADKSSGKRNEGVDWVKVLYDNATATDVAKLTISPLGYVAVAAEAVKAGAYMLQTVNQDDDNLMREAVTLVNANPISDAERRSSPVRPLLRYGTYVFARASTATGAINQDACIVYSPTTRTVRARFEACPAYDPDTSLPKGWSRDWHSVTAIAINVRPVDDQICRPLNTPPTSVTPTGVIKSP